MPYKIETIKLLNKAGLVILPGTKLVVVHEGVARGYIRSGFAKNKLTKCNLEGKPIREKPKPEPVSERRPVEDDRADDSADNSGGGEDPPTA